MPNPSSQKGKIGEDKFRSWLDARLIPFFGVDQKQDRLSVSLKQKFKSKRPDFIIFVPKIGLIIVDVKYLSIDSVNKAFLLDPEDIEKYSNLEKNFNYKVWFAFSNASLNDVWYWVSVAEVLEKCKDQTKRFLHKTFEKPKFAGIANIIPVSLCIPIGPNDSLNKMIDT
jgi:hypothetical protein